jgi:hypothetical protein
VKYRISLSIIVDSYDDAKPLYDFLAKARALFRTIRKGEPNEERSLLILEKHYHDEDPSKPCEVLESISSD